MVTNFAIIGCGKIAKKHIHVIQNLIDEANVAALYDISKDRVENYSKEYGVPGFTSIDAMMNAVGDDIDIINIATPSGAHVTNVLEFAKYGKPLVIEKPIALRLNEADQIISECDRNGVKVFVVHQNRFNTPVIQARKAVDEGRFGKLVLGTIRMRWTRDQKYYDSEDWRGTWAFDGGVFANQAAHHIDMLRWFMGDIESLRAMATTRLVDIECEDTGVAVLKFTSGALGIIEATTATRPKDLEGSISILGEKGSVVIGGFFMNELDTWQFEDHQEIDDMVFEKYRTNPKDWGHNLSLYLIDVIRSIRESTVGLVDGLEGRKSLEIISAIYESIETGKDVTLRFRPQLCKLGEK